MNRTCESCGKSVNSESIIYLAKKVQFDFGSADCEAEYAKHHKSYKSGKYCDYCNYTLDKNFPRDPNLSIVFGKYVVDFCCAEHRTKWFNNHLIPKVTPNTIKHFRLTLHNSEENSYDICNEANEINAIENGEVIEGCEAFDLIGLGDAADLCTGGIPIFTIIRMASS